MLLTAQLNDCRSVPGNTDPIKYKLQPLLFFFFLPVRKVVAEKMMHAYFFTLDVHYKPGCTQLLIL